MKNLATYLIFVAFSITGTNAFSQNLLIKDYKVPVSSAHSFLVDFNYNYASVGQETTSNHGRIGTVYNTFYESLTYGYSFDLIWAASRERRANDYNTDIDGRLRRYIWPHRNFFGSVNPHSAYLKSYEHPTLDVTIGIGFGRFINATALAKAVRIEDFLLFSDQLHDDLPAGTMVKLGQIIEKRGEYRTRHREAFKRFWYDDMAEIIKDSKMLKGYELDAASILRMDEVLFREKISDRFYGWDITLGAKLEILTSESLEKRVVPAADITARYSLPINWRAQFNERFTANSQVGGNFLRTYNLISASDFSYEVTNRIDFVTRHRIKIEKRSKDDYTLISNSLKLLFVFFIENQINLTTSIELEKHRQTKLKQNFLMTLNYRVF
jgi:hypothetical protein